MDNKEIDLSRAKKMMENMKSRSKQFSTKSSGGLDYWVCKEEGDYEIRVLQISDDHNVTGVHWGVLKGKEGRNGGTVKCPAVWDSSPCPVCELVQNYYSSDDDEERKIAEKLKVNLKFPMLILDVNEDGAPKPRIYEGPKTAQMAVVKLLANPKYAGLLDLEQGRNLTLTRYKEGDYTKYSVIADPDRSRANVDPEKLPNLDEVMKPRSYADIEYALVNGEYPPNADEDEETPKEKKKPTQYDRGLPATKTRDEEPEDIEQEEVPVVKKTLKAVEKPIEPLEPPKSANALPKASGGETMKEKLERLKAGRK